MKYLYCLLIIFSLLISCSKKENRESTIELSKIEQIRSLYDSLPNIELPFIYEIDSTYNSKSSCKNPIRSDNPILEGGAGVQIVGKIKDTTNFFGFVYLYPGDLITPVVSTFNKQGNLIERNPLLGGGTDNCGYDCPLTKCTIDKNLIIEEIYIERTYVCEEDTTINNNDITTTITTERYQLNKYGKMIILSNKKLSRTVNSIFEKQ